MMTTAQVGAGSGQLDLPGVGRTGDEFPVLVGSGHGEHVGVLPSTGRADDQRAPADRVLGGPGQVDRIVGLGQQDDLGALLRGEAHCGGQPPAGR